MKTFISAALLAAIAVSSLPAQAAVDPAIVSADARWVVYADLNTLRSTALGKELIAMAEQAQLQNSKIGLNVPKVLETVGTLTAYGSNFSPKPEAMDGTLILQGTPDLRKIAESILLQATIAYPDVVAESKELPFPSYSVTAKQQGDKPQLAVIVAFPPEPIVLVSKSRPQLLKARELYRGGGSGSIARTSDAPLRPLLRGAPGAYLFAASIVPADTAFPENQPQARILKMTNSGSVAIGEQGPNTFAHARLIATSDDMADKLMKILQGMTAMMSLAQTNDKDLSQFLNSAAVTREDHAVALNLSYSTQRLAEMLHSFAERPHESREEVAERQRERLLNGEPVAEWHAESAKAAGDHEGSALAWRTIENVELKNGARISLGQDSRGGKSVKFDRVEITPAAGGSPMVFKRDFMRSGGPRGNLYTFAFPGVDGRYTLKVGYENDPAGKAMYAVSVRQPKAPEAPKSPEPPKPADEHSTSASEADKS